MSGNPLKLKIAYLYPDMLYGMCDIANIGAFVQRAKMRDIEVSVQEIQRNDRIQSAKYDFFYIGGANFGALSNVLKCLNENKDELTAAMASKVPMLAVYCGYMLFSKSYQLYNRTEKQGLRFLNVKSYALKERIYTPVSAYCEFLKEKTVAGFKNCCADFVLGQDCTPFLKIKPTLAKKTYQPEGARKNLLFGTSITSALLAQNPHLCDFFIVSALKTKYRCSIPLMPLVDDIEWFSHKFMFELR